MLVHICERCGKEFMEPPRKKRYYLTLFRYVQGMTTAGAKIDLCPACDQMLAEFMDGPMSLSQIYKVKVRRNTNAFTAPD